MAKNLAGALEIATANRLRDGAVVFRATDGRWSTSLVEAEIAADRDHAARLLASAEADAGQALVVAPSLIAVATANGQTRPLSLRERIRADGPTVAPSTAQATGQG